MLRLSCCACVHVLFVTEEVVESLKSPGSVSLIFGLAVVGTERC